MGLVLADAHARAEGTGTSALGVALGLSTGALVVVTAFLAHEWGHLAGARFAGARYTIPAKPGLFVFNFDFAQNSLEQFRTMSFGGQGGSLLAVLLVWWALPLDTAGRAMLFSASVGSGAFGALIEWPVLARVSAGGDPLAELSKIDRALLYRNAAIAGALTLALWLLIA